MAVFNVVSALVITLIVLKIKTSILEALDEFRKECDEKYMTKEVATERQEAIRARLDRLERPWEHGT